MQRRKERFLLTKIPFKVGDIVTTAKTVSESDVYLFAGITGDFHPNHTNEEYMSKSVYGHRIAHGMLTMSLASAASAKAVMMSGIRAVNYGFDKARFLKGVYFGDTLTTHYKIEEIDEDKMTSTADIKVFNQRNELCFVARNILKFFDEPTDSELKS